jgi:hypothetical protein
MVKYSDVLDLELPVEITLDETRFPDAAATEQNNFDINLCHLLLMMGEKGNEAFMGRGTGRKTSQISHKVRQRTLFSRDEPATSNKRYDMMNCMGTWSQGSDQTRL